MLKTLPFGGWVGKSNELEIMSRECNGYNIWKAK